MHLVLFGHFSQTNSSLFNRNPSNILWGQKFFPCKFCIRFKFNHNADWFERNFCSVWDVLHTSLQLTFLPVNICKISLMVTTSQAWWKKRKKYFLPPGNDRYQPCHGHSWLLHSQRARKRGDHHPLLASSWLTCGNIQRTVDLCLLKEHENSEILLFETKLHKSFLILKTMLRST